MEDYVVPYDSNKPIPIKDILENPQHPLHDTLKEMLEKLERGEISLS